MVEDFLFTGYVRYFFRFFVKGKRNNFVMVEDFLLNTLRNGSALELAKEEETKNLLGLNL